MRVQDLFAALFFALTASPIADASLDIKDSVEEKRTACNQDDPLRALSGHASAGAAFCRTFIPIVTATTTLFPNPGVTPRLYVQFLYNTILLRFRRLIGSPSYHSVTTTATATYTVYPGGRKLELHPLPSYLYQYGILRASSACSCFSVKAPTSTVTATKSVVVNNPTTDQQDINTTPTNIPQTVTTTRTITSTLSGPCATNTPYVGAGGFTRFPNETSYEYGTAASNSYACCQDCQNSAQCIAYYYNLGPNPSNQPLCHIFAENVPGQSTCVAGNGGVQIFVGQGFSNDLLDNLGGTGRCVEQVLICPPDCRF